MPIPLSRRSFSSSLLPWPSALTIHNSAAFTQRLPSLSKAPCSPSWRAAGQPGQLSLPLSRRYFSHAQSVTSYLAARLHSCHLRNLSHHGRPASRQLAGSSTAARWGLSCHLQRLPHHQGLPLQSRSGCQSSSPHLHRLRRLCLMHQLFGEHRRAYR